MILLLEDDAERLARFRLACERLRLPLLEWRSAFDFIAHLDEHLASASLISLDHDLISEPGEPDLGDGVMVAKELAARRPSCPSSSTPATASVAAGWKANSNSRGGRTTGSRRSGMTGSRSIGTVP